MSLRGSMESKSLAAAGRIAMVSAILTLPLSLLSIMLTERHDDFARAGQLALQWSGTLIFLVLMLLFRRFLVANCRFGKANGIINALILLNLLYAAISSYTEYLPQGDERLAPIITGLIVLLGLLQTGLGIRLLRLENDLGGMKRPYCWLNILTGVFLASILLVPIGIVVSAISDVMLGTIFFHEARRLAPPP